MTQPKTITIVQLYPREMNIYGDWGNVLTIGRRLQWHGYKPRIIAHHPGKPFPKEADIIIGGGGQDSGQNKVQSDLQTIGETLHALANKEVPMLLVCGLYQLFGRSFTTVSGEILKGISLFKAETVAGPDRLIGNIILETPFGDVVGYENHSGLTTLDADQSPFGVVRKGAGNNGQDKTEGACYKNVIGTYLHGSLLPKNPAIADAIIETAVVQKYGDFHPEVIDDRFADTARLVAARRPR